jgi:hypothetical protein
LKPKHTNYYNILQNISREKMFNMLFLCLFYNLCVGSIVLSFPDKEQTRSLENEPVSMGRYAEPIQKALDAIAEKQEIEVFPAGSRMVQKPLENGVADVTPLVRIHMMASK